MALGGVLLGGFVGGIVGRRLIGANKIGGGAAGVTGAAIGGAMGAGLGTLKWGANALQHGTALTNPMFSNVTGQAYGKRGIDANNLNTKGLALSLHSNRRKSK